MFMDVMRCGIIHCWLPMRYLVLPSMQLQDVASVQCVHAYVLLATDGGGSVTT